MADSVDWQSDSDCMQIICFVSYHMSATKQPLEINAAGYLQTRFPSCHPTVLKYQAERDNNTNATTQCCSKDLDNGDKLWPIVNLLWRRVVDRLESSDRTVEEISPVVLQELEQEFIQRLLHVQWWTLQYTNTSNTPQAMSFSTGCTTPKKFSSSASTYTVSQKTPTFFTWL